MYLFERRQGTASTGSQVSVVIMVVIEGDTNFWTFTGESDADDFLFAVADDRPLEVFILDVSTCVCSLPTPFIIITKLDRDL